jgi:hypothetical protein
MRGLLRVQDLARSFVQKPLGRSALGDEIGGFGPLAPGDGSLASIITHVLGAIKHANQRGGSERRGEGMTRRALIAKVAVRRA